MSASVSDANFDAEVLKASTPVLVDFWAPWCGPCKQLTPIIDELAAEMGGKVKIVKMNIDDSPETPGKYGIRSIPTLILFKDGKVADTRVGGAPKAQLSKWIEEKI